MSAPSPLAAAQSQVGVTEDRENRGLPLTRYGLTDEDPLPWCARFVRWCFTQAGVRLPGNRYLIGNVWTMYNELDAVGALLPRGVPPEPGDIIFLSERGRSDGGTGQHVGIVESAGIMPATVTSIDGNWGNAVKRVVRVRAHPAIKGYARYPVKALA